MSGQTRRRRSRRALQLLMGGLVAVLQFPGCSQQSNLPASGPYDPPHRIVSLVPAVTEMLFAMGAGDRVVGVSSFDTFPPEVLAIPRVGALLDPNLERIFELQPDLVVTYGSQSTLNERLGEVGIRSFNFVSGSIGDLLSSMQALGTVLGDPEAGMALARSTSNALEEIRHRAPIERPSVLLVHSRDPGVIGAFYTEGAPSYLNELIDIAGGENLFADVQLKSFQPSLEEVLKRNPDVIIEMVPSSADTPESIEQRLNDWRRLETLPAVRNRRVYVLAGDYLLIIGPRLHLVAQALSEVIHPQTSD